MEMSGGVYISQLIRFVRVCSNVGDFNKRNHFLTSNMKNFLNESNTFFNREGYLYLACNEINVVFFTSEQPYRYTLRYCYRFCDALHYLLDNIFFRFGSKLYSQIGGIPMGTYCAPLLQICFRFVTRETRFLPRSG